MNWCTCITLLHGAQCHDDNNAAASRRPAPLSHLRPHAHAMPCLQLLYATCHLPQSSTKADMYSWHCYEVCVYQVWQYLAISMFIHTRCCLLWLGMHDIAIVASTRSPRGLSSSGCAGMWRRMWRTIVTSSESTQEQATAAFLSPLGQPWVS